MAGEKTEKATPKKRDDARKKGQVARSVDLGGSLVLAAGLAAMAAFGPGMFDDLRVSMHETLALTGSPEIVQAGPALGGLLLASGQAIAVVMAPIVLACTVAAVAVSAAQNRPKIVVEALKPDPKRMNPIQGAKNLFGKKMLFEGAKSIVKVLAVGAIVGLAVVPQLDELSALVGLPPEVLATRIADDVLAIFVRGTAAYVVIGLVDMAWQRYSHEKQLKMDKQEVKDELKQQNTPAEVKAAQRRRAMQAARARMMAAVPQADVVVTNPTHFAVALKYDAERMAPEVVAKGVDLVARRIREIATENGVPIVPDPPLARSLHGSVEVGQQIPEELYQAVARVLAFVYRLAGQRRTA